MNDAIPSVARIFGHPIHPMLVPFPIAFLCALPVTDIVYLRTGDHFWFGASWWLCLAGIAGGLLAALAGITDFLGRKRIREYRAAWVHFLGNLAAVLLSVVNLWLRWQQPAMVGMPTCVILSLVVLAILAVTGWFGGELSYRYRIGVIAEP